MMAKRGGTAKEAVPPPVEEAAVLPPKERVLRVAIEEFALRGFEGTSTRTIARGADVTMPTIYFHYGDKEGLYLEACKRVFAEANTLTSAALATDRPAAERVLDFVIAHFAAMETHPFMYRYYMRELAQEDSKVLPRILEQVTEGSVVTLHDVLEEAAGRKVQWIEVVLLYGITSGTIQFTHWGGLIQRSIRSELAKGDFLPRLIVERLFPEIAARLSGPSAAERLTE